ncbi:MAG: peroxiredoxin [Bacteroidetes bacterium]|nr:peroxiredoxin [Bacteroidota bacterium]
MPRIGDTAPDFSATTTIGPLQFSDYANNSWVVMFSHPADFTPVCTTELSEFAKEQAFFDAHDTKLIGISIDSIHSHVAWVQNVKEKLGVSMQFPIVADIGMNVSQLYGMLHPGESETATVRAVFFIDPKRTIRLIMYYPLNVGRNMAEIKRVLVALQTADAHKCALPVNWLEGQKVIVPAPKTLKDIEERAAMGYETVDFYLMKRDL